MAGQSLLIPSQALNANSSETLKPYEPGKATGSLDPTLPMPANKDKCGGMGKIIMAVVAVAVAVWAPQFLSTLTNGVLPATGIGGGVIGGAAGSIASQAVGVAIGAQDKFSWKGVALSALAGGITGGLNANTQLFNLTSSPAVNTALRMATANALTQGIGVATGLQKKFDWKGVAASAAGGFAGAAVNARLPEGLDPFLGRVVSGFAAGTAAAVARGGRVAIQQVAVDAFGNAIGGAIAENMQPRQSMYSLGGTSRSSIGLQAPADWSSSLGRSSDNATYGQFVEAFSNPIRFEGGDGIQLAAGPGYSGMGMGGTDRLQVNRDISVFEEASALATGSGRRAGNRSSWLADQAQAASDLYASGAGDVRDTSPATGLLVNPDTGLADFKYSSQVANAMNSSWDGLFSGNGNGNSASPAWSTLRGVASGVGSAVYEMGAPMADLLQVGNELGRSWVTGEPLRDINYVSAVGKMAGAGASTADIVNGGFMSLMQTPDRIAQAYRGGSYELVGEELGQLGVGGALAAWGARGTVPNVRMGAQLAIENGVENLSSPRQLNMQFGGVRVGTGPTGSSGVLTGGHKLLPTEGNVGTYRDLIYAGSIGDNITPNHIPSANRMAREGVSKRDGIAINMEQPVPGLGGRHRATFTYGTQADINLSPRDALAAGIWDARAIYRADGLYTPKIRSGLQEVIEMNRTNHPAIFVKERR